MKITRCPNCKKPVKRHALICPWCVNVIDTEEEAEETQNKELFEWVSCSKNE